jgi:hypothetical protein
MTLQEAIQTVRADYPLARLIRLPRLWYKGRYVVVDESPSAFLWHRLGAPGGYVKPERAWKAAARHLKRRGRA